MNEAAPPALGPARRLAVLVVAWGLYFAASPGVVLRDGGPLVTLVAVALWGAVARRPGRFAFAVETVAGGLGWVGLMGWVAYVWPPLLAWVGPGHGLYAAASGVVLRRLDRVLPLALAVPLAWVGVETVRGLVPPPFGLESLQLGHAPHVWLPFAASARVWGLVGLGLAFGAAAGLLADLARARGRASRAAVAAGLGLPAAALALGALFPAPPAVPGPEVLLVQPAFAQARKQYGSRFDNHEDAAALTFEALAEGARPDLVCWGESMLANAVFEDEVLETLERGWEPPEWQRRWLTPETVARERRTEDLLLDRSFLAHLPDGTAFLAGAEVFRWDAATESVRRGNAVFLWSDGRRSEPALKLHTVPGAETMFGLERIEAVRDAVLEIAGYVPNLDAGVETGVLELAARDGRTYRLGASVCFDNAFLDPYTLPLRRGPLDFHVVVSNEAWFRDGWEAHQMIAYSRIAALASGRALVRATNSGIGAVVAPDGRIERLGGDDVAGTMLRGTLSAAVPVPPTPAAAARRTPFVALEPLWTLLGLAAPAAGLWAARRRASGGAPGRAAPGNGG